MILNQSDVIASQLKAKATAEKIEHIMPAALKAKEEQFASTYLKHKGNSLSKLQYLYDFMEEIYGFVGNFIPCKKGCTHCCHIPVSISVLEAEYITKYTKNKQANTKLPIVEKDTPCPFLIKGACSIYETRPFVCRQHVMLDDTPKWCHINVCNEIKLTQLQFTEIREFYNSLLYDSKKGSRLDIREAFGVRA